MMEVTVMSLRYATMKRRVVFTAIQNHHRLAASTSDIEMVSNYGTPLSYSSKIMGLKISTDSLKAGIFLNRGEFSTRGFSFPSRVR